MLPRAIDETCYFIGAEDDEEKLSRISRVWSSGGKSGTYLGGNSKPIVHGKCLDHPATAVYSENRSDRRHDQEHICDRSHLWASSVGSHGESWTFVFLADARGVSKYRKNLWPLLNHVMTVSLRGSTKYKGQTMQRIDT